MTELGNAIQFTLLPVQTASYWSLCFIQTEFKKLQKLQLHYCVVLCSLFKESFEKWHLVTKDLQGFGEQLQSCLIDFCVVTGSQKEDQWGKKFYWRPSGFCRNREMLQYPALLPSIEFIEGFYQNPYMLAMWEKLYPEGNMQLHFFSSAEDRV